MSAARRAREPVVIAGGRTGAIGTVWLRTDDLSRHPESQIRASVDPALVAEYAEAMLEGAEFPPVIVFQDANGWKYLADGHHRVDAAALAALKVPSREAAVLADVRPGNFDDALRYAMKANVQHGKRMSELDYKRAIKMAFDHKLIEAVHAKDVVPEIVALVGCSIRIAQENSVEKRMEMLKRRDDHIMSMHRAGTTQEAIGRLLQVPQRTVADVIARLSGKRGAAQTARAEPLPEVEWPDEAGEIIEAPVKTTSVDPSYKINVEPYLPLLERLRPFAEGGADMESGAVGGLPDMPGDDNMDLDAVRALSQTEHAIRTFLLFVGEQKDLAKPFPPAAAAGVIELIDCSINYLSELRDYLTGGARK